MPFLIITTFNGTDNFSQVMEIETSPDLFMNGWEKDQALHIKTTSGSLFIGPEVMKKSTLQFKQSMCDR